MLVIGIWFKLEVFFWIIYCDYWCNGNICNWEYENYVGGVFFFWKDYVSRYVGWWGIWNNIVNVRLGVC